MDLWRPSANLKQLRLRAQTLDRTRDFFKARGVLEVETPLLSKAAATDPHIGSMRLAASDGTGFLSTSPEFAMKRLLAAGSGPIYQIARAFRTGEQGGRHNPEFTLIEWYRPGFSLRELMDEVEGLVHHLLSGSKPALSGRRLTYQAAFMEALCLDPLAANAKECAVAARTAGIEVKGELDKDGWLDLLLSVVVGNRFDGNALTFLYDYPASQAALARLKLDDPRVAERFEVFVGDLELANGFHELADAGEQRRRFESDNAARRARGLPEMPVDEHLLEALAEGLPSCSGVALGLDRLLMVASGAERIEDVLAFPWERA